MPRTTERSNESAAGPLYTASDLANVLDLSEEQLRGVSTTTLLQGFGRLFAENGAVARADPQGTFELSRPVKQLDYFVSHAWRTSRWPKFLALLLYFNFWSGVAAYCVAAYVSFWFLTFFFESLPPMYVFAPAPSGYDASETTARRSCWPTESARASSDSSSPSCGSTLSRRTSQTPRSPSLRARAASRSSPFDESVCTTMATSRPGRRRRIALLPARVPERQGRMGGHDAVYTSALVY